MCVDDAHPLSNWGKANMIRPNLKDDQCLPPQRRFTVMHVVLPCAAERQTSTVWRRYRAVLTKRCDCKCIFFILISKQKKEQKKMPLNCVQKQHIKLTPHDENML